MFFTFSLLMSHFFAVNVVMRWHNALAKALVKTKEKKNPSFHSLHSLAHYLADLLLTLHELDCDCDFDYRLATVDCRLSIANNFRIADRWNFFDRQNEKCNRRAAQARVRTRSHSYLTVWRWLGERRMMQQMWIDITECVPSNWQHHFSGVKNRICILYLCCC